MPVSIEEDAERPESCPAIPALRASSGNPSQSCMVLCISTHVNVFSPSPRRRFLGGNNREQNTARAVARQGRRKDPAAAPRGARAPPRRGGIQPVQDPFRGGVHRPL